MFVWVILALVEAARMARTWSSRKEVTPLPVNGQAGHPHLPLRVTIAELLEERKDEYQEEDRDEHQDVGGANYQNEEICRLGEE